MPELTAPGANQPNSKAMTGNCYERHHPARGTLTISEWFKARKVQDALNTLHRTKPTPELAKQLRLLAEIVAWGVKKESEKKT